MNIETQRKNIVHRILDIENQQLLNQIEDLISNEVYTYTASGKPLSASDYKNHLTTILNSKILNFLLIEIMYHGRRQNTQERKKENIIFTF